MEEVKAKLDSVHKLLKKQVSLTEDVKALETASNRGGEEDVNYISGSGFQRFGNQSGNRNFNGAGQSSNFSNNQTSQCKKPFNSNINSGFNEFC